MLTITSGGVLRAAAGNGRHGHAASRVRLLEGGAATCMHGDARRCIESERAAEATHAIGAGMVEIYNEGVWDLLAPGGKRELELARSCGGFDLPDLTQIGAVPLPCPPLSQCSGAASAGA